MMVQAGWMQVGFAFAKAGQRISVKAEGAGWEYTLMGLPGGGVVTGRDSFDQDPINFAASYLKSLEQPEVEAPAIIAQAADGRTQLRRPSLLGFGQGLQRRLLPQATAQDST